MTRCNHLAARADGQCRVCDQNDRAALNRLASLNRLADESQRQQSANHPLTDEERQLAARHAATQRYIDAQERQRLAALNHELIEQEAAKATRAAAYEDIHAALNRLAALDVEAKLLDEYIAAKPKPKPEPQPTSTPHPLGGLPERLRVADLEAEAMHNLDVAAHTSYNPTTDYCHRGHELVAENVIELSGGDPEHPQRICKSCRETYAALPDHLKKHWNR